MFFIIFWGGAKTSTLIARPFPPLELIQHPFERSPINKLAVLRKRLIPPTCTLAILLESSSAVCVSSDLLALPLAKLVSSDSLRVVVSSYVACADFTPASSFLVRLSASTCLAISVSACACFGRISFAIVRFRASKSPDRAVCALVVCDLNASSLATESSSIRLASCASRVLAPASSFLVRLSASTCLAISASACACFGRISFAIVRFRASKSPDRAVCALVVCDLNASSLATESSPIRLASCASRVLAPAFRKASSALCLVSFNGPLSKLLNR
ncbi:Uncharacterised protein [Streptococcus pneumoniae]|nr:Uncharacterised protein [Streptococcus pneumoniae]CVR52541.1 Uncharacterised protein [Streptococcus pneumoniae]VON05709.1 Uncharacterised protein [Streptococcus pneumoniae]VOT57513.1 Uncharacterised protein [Streptococcus pneumoniae]VOV37215.1 Uncharacterised protein [Streptococcus pneumoniae]